MIIPGLINTTWAVWVHPWYLPVFLFHLKLCLPMSPSPGEDWGFKFFVTRRAHRTSACSHLVYLHTDRDYYTNQRGLLWARVSSRRIGIRCGLPRIPGWDACILGLFHHLCFVPYCVDRFLLSEFHCLERTWSSGVGLHKSSKIF